MCGLWSNIAALDFELKMGRIKLKAQLIVPRKIGSADPSFEITLREWNLGGKKAGAKKNNDYQVMDFIWDESIGQVIANLIIFLILNA